MKIPLPIAFAMVPLQKVGFLFAALIPDPNYRSESKLWIRGERSEQKSHFSKGGRSRKRARGIYPKIQRFKFCTSTLAETLTSLSLAEISTLIPFCLSNSA
jgi:hypothetical protein